MSTIQLSNEFHRGEKQNKSHYYTYCKACVHHHLSTREIEPIDVDIDAAAAFTNKEDARNEAFVAVGSVRGEKLAWIAHLIGGKGVVPCKYASIKVKAEATAQREIIKSGEAPKPRGRKENPAGEKRSLTSLRRKRGNSDSGASDIEIVPPKKAKQGKLRAYNRVDMPFGETEGKAVEVQALKAVISGNLPFKAFEDVEMRKLIQMIRPAALDIIPTAKLLSGRLLDEAVSTVEGRLMKVMEKKELGLSTDGWKSITKASIHAICANVDFKVSYTIELVDSTDAGKDGAAQCRQFAEIIDRIEAQYQCKIIYLTTDADGGSKKGRVLLQKERPHLILPSCWAHQFQLILGDYFKEYPYAAEIAEQATGLIGWLNNHGKVRTLMDKAQAQISKDRTGRIVVLTYLVANLTRWTTHCVAFMRLLMVKEALQLAVMQHCGALVAAQVGAAKSKERDRLDADANSSCDLISDHQFWIGLETVVGDIEPICYGTNINQKDSTRADQVLLSLAVKDTVCYP